jgi:hypothetical protein
MVHLQKRLYEIKIVLAPLLIIAFSWGAAQASTLETLERERAQTIAIILDPTLEPSERAAKLETARLRLVDLERMVLRDDEIMKSAKPIVRRAFADYDLTFLVHASVEKDRALSDHWLSEIGVTTDHVLGARIGRRY